MLQKFIILPCNIKLNVIHTFSPCDKNWQIRFGYFLTSTGIKIFFYFFFICKKTHCLHHLQYGLNSSLNNTTFYLQFSAYWLLTLLTIQDSTYNSIHTALNIKLTRLLTTTGYTLQKVGKQ